MFFRDLLLKAQIPYSSNQLYDWGLGTSGQLGYGILPGSFTQIVGGPSHTAGITSTGSLMLWGLGTNGQLGDGFQVTRSTPTQVPGVWISVAVGDLHTVAVRADNRLFAWGRNINGQVGDGTTIDKSSPVQLGSLATWSKVGAGFSNTYAVTLAGTLYGWGLNNIGQVGDITTLNRSSPVAIGASTSWSAVSGGQSFTTALRSDGTLWAWGLNSAYQLGNTEIRSQSSPVQIGLNNSWLQVSSGTSHSAAVRSDRTLWVWGVGTAISLSGNQAYSWSKIASGPGSHAAAIRSDGSLWTWGFGSTGQIGDGQTLTRSSPTVIGVGTWIDVAVGPGHMAGVSSDGKLFTWGLNTSGQLGDNTLINKSSPIQIAAGTSFINVSLGLTNGIALDSAKRLYAWGQQASTSLGGNIFPDTNPVSKGYNNGENGALIRTDGTLWVWGYNISGTIGDGTTISKSSPVQVAGSWTSLSVGSGHILGIKTDSTLWAWGSNALGQLGLGTTVDRSSPVQVGVAANWSLISAGTNFSLAINALGQLYAWGANDLGQLGDNTVVNESSPTQIGTTTSWNAVSAGSSHSMAINSDGNLFTWGYGIVGNLGHNNTQSLSNPTQVTSVTNSWTQVAAGWLQSHAITTLGEQYGWGGNGGGQLGINSNIPRSVPTIVPGTTSWTQVAANLNTSYAIDTLGKLYSAGVNSDGSSGLNDVTGAQLSNYTQLTVGTSYTFISAGGIGRNAAAVSSDSKYYAWGQNTNGQIGNGDTLTKIAPFTLLAPATPSFSSPTIIGSDYFSEISAGVSYALGLKTDYTLWGWGFNDRGQLGNGDTINRSSPTQVGNYFNLGPLSYTQIAAGWSHGLAISTSNKLYTWGINTSMLLTNQVFSWTQVIVGQLHGAAIRSDGLLFTWGSNTQGQLGNNSTTQTNSPILISSGNSWSVVAAGNSNTAAIDTSGRLYAWGANDYGQLGQGDTGGTGRSVITQLGSATNWTKVSLGEYYLMAINSDNQLYGTGINTSGSLGVGDAANRSNLTIIPGATSWSQVSAGKGTTGAIDNTGKIWLWGVGTSGQIGNGLALSRSSPVQISASVDWNKIAVGASHVIAIKSDTTLWAWGIGTSGQTGNGSALSRSSPVLVSAAGLGGVSSYTQIGAGADFSVAQKSDGTLWGWGLNTSGQLGDNTTVNKSTPVQLLTGLSFTSIGTFGGGLNQWAAVLRNNNTIYTWGFNTSGQIADSTSVTKSSPTQLGSVGLMGSMSYPVQITVGTGSWSQVAAGSSFSLAIRSDNTLWAWGLNNNSQLGINDAVSRSSPTQVSGAGTSSYTQIAATVFNGYGIQSDNLLYGWGLGTSGQVGDLTIVTKAVPTKVGNLSTGLVVGTNSPYQVGSGSSYTQVSASNLFTAVLRTDGAIFAWGVGSNGQLGQGNTVSYSSPIQVGLSSYAQVSAGGNNLYGILTNRLLLATGIGTGGTIGDSSLVSKSTPVLVINTVIASASSPVQVGLLSWSVVSAGATHTAAIDSNGLLFEWGLGANGALAVTPADTINRSSPVQVGTSSWSAVSVGKSNFTLGIRSDNTLWGWGLNAAYQLGIGDSLDRSSPVQISATPWNKISAGLSAAGAIDNTGALYMWGTNTSGILGDNQTAITARSVPLQIGTSSWSQLSVGLSHTLAIDSLGRMFAWGLNTGFRLGDSTSITKSSPTLVGGSASWLQISAGADHSVAIKSDLSLWAWGNGATGALGIVSTPYSWTQVAEGNSFAIGLRSDNTIWSWGYNNQGQLGLGDTFARSSPVQIGTGNSWTFVYAGWYNSGAIRNDGTMFTWGYNNVQQLGDGTAIDKSSPVQVLGTYSFSQASAGSNHVIAIGANNVGLYTWGPITSTFASAADISYAQVSEGAGGHTAAIRWDGYLFVWGNNSAGQVGKNVGAATFSSPVQIGVEKWSLVSAGLSHTLGIDNSGRLFAWGLNSQYQLGTNDSVNRSAPIQIGIGSSWIGIAAGYSHSMAIRSDGILFAWGVGTSGQQGALTTVKSWSSISAGATHSVGVSDSKLYVWGLNSSSQLGTNDAVNRSSPTLLSSTDSSSWKLVSAGSTHTLFTQYDNSAWAVGLNNVGQIGDLTTTNRASPVLVGTGFTVIDASNTPHTITKSGTTYSTTTVPVTGAVSGYFAGNTVDVVTTASTDYVIGASTDFTVECWVNIVTLFGGGTTDFNAPISCSDGTNTWYLWWCYNGYVNSWGFSASADGGVGPYQRVVTSDTNYGVPGWHHLAIVRQSGQYRLYVDGVQSVGTTGSNPALTTGTPTITIGRIANGYISNVRFVKGTAVYTGNFTPPTQAVLGVSGATSSAAYPSTTNVNTTFIAANTMLLTYTTFAATITGGAILYTKISAGASHSAGINAAGQLFTWGRNDGYILGNGDTLNRSSPVQISFGTSSYTQVSLGLSTSAAIDSSGALWAWGVATGGQLANSSVVTPSLPVQVAPGTSWSNISMGYSHTLAVKSDGTLWAWGKNSDGQLGTWTAAGAPAGVTTSSPVQVSAPGTNWSSISAGISHSLGIQTDGTIWGWGANEVGQVGYIPPAESLYSWTQVRMAINDTAGVTHVAALRSDGSLWTWGNNAAGQLGVGDSANRSSPVQVGTLSNYSQISAGASHTLAIKTDGTLWGWGANANWQLGLGAADSVNRSSPVLISSTESWSIISAGYQHSSALDSLGRMYYWGNTVPTQNFIFSWTAVSTGGSHTVAIRNDGKLFTWGINNNGQLGDGTTLNKSSPNQIGSSSWSSISAGGGFTLAVKPDGTLWTWGYNAFGQIGVGDAVNRSSPVQVTSPSVSWLSVSGGGIHSIATDTTGLLYAWGLGSSGELGLNDAANRSIPTQIGTSSWSVVSAGNQFTMAIDSSSRLFSFGSNLQGRLGQGNAVNYSSPVQIGTSNWSKVSAGTTHAIAIRSDSTLWAWGNGTNGELGYGSALSRSSPVQIGTSSWTSVAAAYLFSTAITTDGKLFTWGLGTSGETGFNTAVSRSSPVQVLATLALSFTVLGASNSAGHAAAISTLGLLYTWGTGNVGQTGVGDLQNRSSPVNIGTTTGAAGALSTTQYQPARIGTSSWSAISAGQSYQMAIRSGGSLFTWGLNSSGQLGIGNVATYSSPVQIGTSSWSLIQASTSFSYGVWSTTGALYTWGINTSFQGGRTDGVNRSSPVLSGAASTVSFSQISAGNSWGIGITTALAGNFALYTWGTAGTPETGASGIAKSVPAQLGTATSWTVIGGSAAINNSLLYIWGGSGSGQQGEGTTYARSSPVILGYKINIVSPVQIASGSWAQVEAGKGSGFSLATDSSGTFYGWGQDSTGQLGI